MNSRRDWADKNKNGWRTVGTLLEPAQLELLDICADVTGLTRSSIVRALIKAYIDSVTGLEADPQQARVEWARTGYEARLRMREKCKENLFNIRHYMNGPPEAEASPKVSA